jgi:hypothetical protein
MTNTIITQHRHLLKAHLVRHPDCLERINLILSIANLGYTPEPLRSALADFCNHTIRLSSKIDQDNDKSGNRSALIDLKTPNQIKVSKQFRHGNWFNNGVKNIRLPAGIEPPAGFERGMIADHSNVAVVDK